MIDRDLFIGYRTFTVRAGLLLSWLGIAGYAWLANRGPGPIADGAPVQLALLGAVVLGLTVTPWQKVLLNELGDAVLAGWAAIAAWALIAAHELHSGEPQSLSFILIVVFAAASLVRPGYLIVVAGVVFTGYAVSLDRARVDFSLGGTRIQIGLFALSVLFAIAASFGVTRVFNRASRRLHELRTQGEELERRRRQLDELYAVSATIGLGGTLAEIVPQLMGRIVDALDARVGLVFLFRPEHDDLELISPLWVAGRTVRAEGYRLSLTERGPVQRVFTSGEPLVSNDSRDHPTPLLGDLDATRLAAVPMAVDGRPTGVLVVADKAGAGFDDADIARLKALAGPAALVMNQMDRYDAAQETSQKMAELAQLKSDFVGVVSHELRSPLTSIIGSLHTLMRPDLKLESAMGRELIETAARQADRLRALIEDLLVASRLDSNALPVRPEPTDVAALIRDLLHELPATAGRVQMSVDEALPAVQVDPAHLARIIRNLVENALKYAGESEISVTAILQGDQAWISVIDRGPGISYELHDHIFQPFTQAQHHETRAQGGTGLGLSIVRGLAEAMGGRAWFEPTAGGGATFTVAFPLRTGARTRPS